MAAFLAFIALTLLGNNWLQTSSYDVSSLRLPASFDGYRVVQVSDLHNHVFGEDQSRLLRAIKKARPDLIAITGDLTFVGTWSRDEVRSLTQNLTAVAPVCFASGNHEALSRRYPALKSLLESLGVMMLEGDSTLVTRGADSIVLSGIQDPLFFGRQDRKAKMMYGWRTALAALRTTIPPDQYTVLLSHRPEFIDDYASLGFDLVLAGHAHGGQVRLPVIGALYSPDQGWLPRYTSGKHTRGHTTMIISRGLGKSLFPFRVFNRPELVVVRLTKAAK